MRAKFRCNTVKFSGNPTDPNAPRTYELSAVYDNGTEENRRFNRYTPWGQLQMTVDNPDAGFNVAEEYYFDITPCAPTEAAAWRGEETVEDHSRDIPQPTHMGNTHDVTGVYTPGHAATEDTPATTSEATTYTQDRGYTGTDPARAQADADNAAPDTTTQASQDVTRTTPSGEPVDTIDASGHKVDTTTSQASDTNQ